jgi:hypothetical protein
MVFEDISDPVGTDLGIVTVAYEIDLYAAESPKNEQNFTVETLRFADATDTAIITAPVAPTTFDLLFSLEDVNNRPLLAQFKPFGCEFHGFQTMVGNGLSYCLAFPKGWWRVRIRFGYWTSVPGVSVTFARKHVIRHRNGKIAQTPLSSINTALLPAVSDEWKDLSLNWTENHPGEVAEEYALLASSRHTEVVNDFLHYYSDGYDSGVGFVYETTSSSACTLSLRAAEMFIEVQPL